MLQSLVETIDLSKPYESQQVEQHLYTWWEESGFFPPNDDAPLPPFVISIPPPNVTGELHLGHAMFVAIEDLLIRWRRMQGYKALWVPGTDHAGIATQLQVEKLLKSEGTSRQDVGRDEFLRRTWQWKEKYGGEITRQIRLLGASCDWQREHFTLDKDLCYAVHTAFKRLYDDGLIYRGTYLVNWSPNLQTAVSDLEVEHITRNGSLWYVRYPLLPLPTNNHAHASLPSGEWGSGTWAHGATDFITVATTRPETILGDTAVAVNPTDERYAHLVGRTAVLPALGRYIPIIADEYVDATFGTGAVKITPAHDPNDYEVGKRHNLPMINIMRLDASLNNHAGCYAGMERFEARAKLLADLETETLLVKTEPHTSSVGVSQRGGEVIEPLLSEQWFVRMRPLADVALAAVKNGDTRIIPEHFEKVYTHWLENIEDWCISRQLWWGHRIPVWYMPDGTVVVPAPNEPPPDGATQDPDVLDTWFSSGIWPFSTLGWPHDTADLHHYYPTSVMETGYDILFFWVARMMMMGCYLTGVPPFHTIYLHGLVRDEHGRKMSKSFGNVVNPLTVMEEYGTDALRYTLITSGAPGQDINLNPQRIESARNFANKVWNITRFVIGARTRVQKNTADNLWHNGTPPNTDSAENHMLPPVLRLVTFEREQLTLADKWIISRYNRLVSDSDRLLEHYNFGEAYRQIHDFVWSEFADWYLEVAKVQLESTSQQQVQTCEILFAILDGCLRLLHPVMPFVTEAAWQFLMHAETRPIENLPDALMVARYPVSVSALHDATAEATFEHIRTIITTVRNVRNEYKVEPARWIAAIVNAGDAATAATLNESRLLLCRLARIENDHLTIVESLATKPEHAATVVTGTVEVFLPLADLIDSDAECERLGKELQGAIDDAARREMRLANGSFVEKAPPHVVQKERDALTATQEKIIRLRERLSDLGDTTNS